eukprot:g806.t1
MRNGAAGPAEEAGLCEGDVLLGVGGRSVLGAKLDDVLDVLRAAPTEHPVHFRILRPAAAADGAKKKKRRTKLFQRQKGKIVGEVLALEAQRIDGSLGIAIADGKCPETKSRATVVHRLLKPVRGGAGAAEAAGVHTFDWLLVVTQVVVAGMAARDVERAIRNDVTAASANSSGWKMVRGISKALGISFGGGAKASSETQSKMGARERKLAAEKQKQAAKELKFEGMHEAALARADPRALKVQQAIESGESDVLHSLRETEGAPAAEEIDNESDNVSLDVALLVLRFVVRAQRTYRARHSKQDEADSSTSDVSAFTSKPALPYDSDESEDDDDDESSDDNTEQQKKNDEIDQDGQEQAQRDLQQQVHHDADEQVQRGVEDQAQRETGEQPRLDAEARARREAEERARREAEERARREAEKQARREAEKQARREAEERARRKAKEDARTKAKANEDQLREAIEDARREAIEIAKREARAETERAQAEAAALRAQLEASQKKTEDEARREAEAQTKRDNDAEKARAKAAALKAHLEASESQALQDMKREEETLAIEHIESGQQKEGVAARATHTKSSSTDDGNAVRSRAKNHWQQAISKARSSTKSQAARTVGKTQQMKDDEAERKRREERRIEVVAREAEKRARHEDELKRKREEERAQLEAKEQARREAEEQMRIQAKEKARREAEDRVRREAEHKAKIEAEMQAKKEAEKRERVEFEARVRKEVEEKMRQEAKAREEAEIAAKQKAKEDALRAAEEHSRREAEERAKREEERGARAALEASIRAELKAELAQEVRNQLVQGGLLHPIGMEQLLRGQQDLNANTVAAQNEELAKESTSSSLCAAASTSQVTAAIPLQMHVTARPTPLPPPPPPPPPPAPPVTPHRIMTQSDSDLAVSVPPQGPTQSSSLPAIISPTEQSSLSSPQSIPPVTAVTGAEVRELHRVREEVVANAWAEAEMVVTEARHQAQARVAAAKAQLQQKRIRDQMHAKATALAKHQANVLKAVAFDEEIAIQAVTDHINAQADQERAARFRLARELDRQQQLLPAKGAPALGAAAKIIDQVTAAAEKQRFSGTPSIDNEHAHTDSEPAKSIPGASVTPTVTKVEHTLSPARFKPSSKNVVVV